MNYKKIILCCLIVFNFFAADVLGMTINQIIREGKWKQFHNWYYNDKNEEGIKQLISHISVRKHFCENVGDDDFRNMQVETHTYVVTRTDVPAILSLIINRIREGCGQIEKNNPAQLIITVPFLTRGFSDFFEIVELSLGRPNRDGIRPIERTKYSGTELRQFEFVLYLNLGNYGIRYNGTDDGEAGTLFVRNRRNKR